MFEAQPTLLIESGNSSWKAARLRANALEYCSRGSDFGSLRNWLRERPEQRIVLATVGDENDAVLLVSELQQRGYEIYRVQTSDITHFTHCYTMPEKLGVDRWLTMVALRDRPLPVAIVDVGTAITLDVMNIGGVHLGGWIAPGFLLMQESLVSRSRRLAVHEHEPQHLLGTSTEEAISLGCAAALQGFVEQAIQTANGVLNRQPYELYLTGGGVRHLNLAQLPPHQLRPHLVLEGLQAWAKERL
ncbi:type III pantothenate kinase [Aliidiomarina celeris]|uniref:type III pantothenate kinase n=1 Tax=Aliidiomarina celeris TaxID=2249428 RepID=UPI000DE845D3|nr:type III pantothenate kinase [Aliidiomarina celeris]